MHLKVSKKIHFSGESSKLKDLVKILIRSLGACIRMYASVCARVNRVIKAIKGVKTSA